MKDLRVWISSVRLTGELLCHLHKEGARQVLVEHVDCIWVQLLLSKHAFLMLYKLVAATGT